MQVIGIFCNETQEILKFNFAALTYCKSLQMISPKIPIGLVAWAKEAGLYLALPAVFKG